MATQFSPGIAVPTQDGYPFISHRIEVDKLGRFASPMAKQPAFAWRGCSPGVLGERAGPWRAAR